MAGMSEGILSYEDGEPVACDVAYAIAERYYTMAIEYDAPDGTR